MSRLVEEVGEVPMREAAESFRDVVRRRPRCVIDLIAEPAIVTSWNR